MLHFPVIGLKLETMKPIYTQAAYVVAGIVIGLIAGYNNGVTKSDLDWKQNLITRDLAEYNRKTGKWQFRNLEEIQMANVLGTSLPHPQSPSKESSSVLYTRPPSK